MKNSPLYLAALHSSQELFDFSALFSRDRSLLQKAVSDVILYALEAGLFVQDPLGNVVCKNEGELIRRLWEKVSNWPAVQAEAKIYQLSPLARASVYLFVRKGMNEQLIAALLAAEQDEVSDSLAIAFQNLTGEAEIPLEVF